MEREAREEDGRSGRMRGRQAIEKAAKARWDHGEALALGVKVCIAKYC